MCNREKKILAAFFKLKLAITEFAKKAYLEQFYTLYVLEKNCECLFFSR